jgi:SLT domain-containing protein
MRRKNTRKMTIMMRRTTRVSMVRRTSMEKRILSQRRLKFLRVPSNLVKRKYRRYMKSKSRFLRFRKFALTSSLDFASMETRVGSNMIKRSKAK